MYTAVAGYCISPLHHAHFGSDMACVSVGRAQAHINRAAGRNMSDGGLLWWRSDLLCGVTILNCYHEQMEPDIPRVLAEFVGLTLMTSDARHLDFLISMHSRVSKTGLRFNLILNVDVSKLANLVAVALTLDNLDYTKAYSRLHVALNQWKTDFCGCILCCVVLEVDSWLGFVLRYYFPFTVHYI